MTTSQTSQQSGKTESSAVAVYGTLVAVLIVNLGILMYAISVSKSPETIIVEQKSELKNPKANGEESGKASDSNDDTQTASVDDSFYDQDEFDDWDFDEPDVVNPIELPDDGTLAQLFKTQCSYCHGDTGRGDGPAAEYLLPRPRDLIASPFRYATLGGDRDQITMDLERTIEQGVPRSGMPGFGGVLSDLDIVGLAHYVLSLREQSEDAEETYEEPLISIGMRPAWTPQLVKRGKELFTTLACNTCHGNTGRGDGANAASLVDMQEKPVRPADLTSGLFKSGQKPDDLVRTIMKGVPGTPMVAYEMAVTHENDDGTVNVIDAWALVAYIRSLSVTEQPPGQPSGALIMAYEAPDIEMLTDPTHVGWLGIEPTLVSVKPLYQREEHTTFVEVRAARYESQLAICLDWHDDTLNMLPGDHMYSDAISAMFGTGDQIPPLPLGIDVPDTNSTPPVVVWHWSAATHFQAQEGREATPADIDAAKKRGWQILTNEESGDSARSIEVQVVTGIGLPKPMSDQPRSVSASAVWSRTQWRTIITGSVAEDDQQGLRISSQRSVPVSFAVWDGEKGNKQLLSSWHWLVWNQ